MTMENIVAAGTFGDVCIPSSSRNQTASYQALSTPRLPVGSYIQTYCTDPASGRSAELPSATLSSPSIEVNEVGHITIRPSAVTTLVQPK
jgi:hypothetical protein